MDLPKSPGFTTFRVSLTAHSCSDQMLTKVEAQRVADKVAHVAHIFEMSAADRSDDMSDREAEIERAAYQDCADFLRHNVLPLLPEPNHRCASPEEPPSV